jgi:hypothetical protein
MISLLSNPTVGVTKIQDSSLEKKKPKEKGKRRS